MLRFIIRVIPEGKASDYLMEMPLGTTVSMTGPHGFFVLDAVHTGDIVFAATGTGIAAVMPMLGELALRPAPRRGRACSIFWGLRQRIGHLRARRDRAPGGRDRRRAGDPSDRARPGLDGRPGPHHARAARSAAAPAAPTFYLVGNGAMITELKRELISRGVNRKTQIRTEAFFD